MLLIRSTHIHTYTPPHTHKHARTHAHHARQPARTHVHFVFRRLSNGLVMQSFLNFSIPSITWEWTPLLLTMDV